MELHIFSSFKDLANKVRNNDLAAFGQISYLTLLMDPVKMAIQDSWLWLIFFVVVAGGGIWFQFVTNRDYEIEEYNRYSM